MKEILIKILRRTLRELARLTIWRFRPGIVGVTGNVGKTSTKLAIAAVLSTARKTRWSKGNLNNDLGLPLTILGDWSEEELRLVSLAQSAGERQLEKILFWLKVISTSIWHLVIGHRTNYPEILVLEYGADHPGDIKYLLSIARPNVSVITAVGEVPAHLENFPSGTELAREKARLIECLPTAGYAVLNHDNPTVMELRDRTRARIMTFGFNKGSDVRVVNFENRSDSGRPTGIWFKLDYGGGVVPAHIADTFGKSQASAAAGASAVGIIFGLNLIKISEVLGHYIPADGRMQLISGIRSSYLLDDSYNANPMSTRAALETLKAIPGNKRKVAILGDMLELGRHSLEAHEGIGAAAAKDADMLVTIGARAKDIANGARKAGMPKRAIQSYETLEEAKTPVEKLIKKEDVVLIKASHGMHFEEIVKILRAEPRS